MEVFKNKTEMVNSLQMKNEIEIYQDDNRAEILGYNGVILNIEFESEIEPGKVERSYDHYAYDEPDAEVTITAVTARCGKAVKLRNDTIRVIEGMIEKKVIEEYIWNS